MDAKSTGPRCEDPRCPAAALETWQSQTTSRIVQTCHHHGREWQMALYDQGFRLMESTPA